LSNLLVYAKGVVDSYTCKNAENQPFFAKFTFVFLLVRRKMLKISMDFFPISRLFVTLHRVREPQRRILRNH